MIIKDKMSFGFHNKIAKKISRMKAKGGANICVLMDAEEEVKNINQIIEHIDNINEYVVTDRDGFLMHECEKDFDIIITDIEFNGIIYSTFVTQIRSFLPNAKIIVLTRLENDYYRKSAMNCCANFFFHFGIENSLLETVIQIMVKKSKSSMPDEPQLNLPK
ncbi:MAG: response regulator transcription factor [Chlorobi bacterium]|nr:response regulator transcription factor [Chlorobiota bacterium]